MKKTIDGVELSYTLTGEGKKNLLLLHGWGCDGRLMQPIADAFRNQFRILIPDFPGHGSSGRPPEPWGVKEYTDCLVKFLQEENHIPCCIIAHSFGCRVAAMLAAEHPAMTEKMIFTGAAGIRPVPSAEAQKRSARYKRLKLISEKVKKIPLMSSPTEKFETKLREKYGSRDYNALDEEMRKTFVKVINQDLTELYEKIQASTLLVWGSADTETPLWMGQKMEKLIPDAGLVVLEGATHFAYLEQAQRFIAIAKQFFREDS